MRRLLVLPPLLIVLLCGFLAVSDDAPLIVVEDIRMGVNGEGQTRIVLDTDGRPGYLAGPVGEAEPEIVIHLQNGRFALSGSGEGTGFKAGKGVIKRVTYAPDLVRITLNETALVTRDFILPPSGKIGHHRLVLDIDPVPAKAFAGAAAEFKQPLDTAPEPEPRPTLAEVAGKRDEASVPAPSLKPVEEPAFEALPVPVRTAAGGAKTRPLIVIDPGHGGRDGGATGRSGTSEDTVTLAYAQDLRRMLMQRGYDVLLTRNDDTYVEHEDRIGLARTEGADLFLSIHADSHEDSSLRGASVYTLSQRRSERLESEIRRDGNFVLFDVEVSNEDGVGDILLDLAQSATRHNSDRLATSLIDAMRPTMPLLKNPKRRGALLVLLSPDVPAVLVELAFLSNVRDEANLTSPAWRRSTATAIADGIDNYFDQSGIEQRLAGAGSDSG